MFRLDSCCKMKQDISFVFQSSEYNSRNLKIETMFRISILYNFLLYTMIPYLVNIHSFSSVRWVTTAVNIAYKIIPQIKYSETIRESEKDKEVELDGKILYESEIRNFPDNCGESSEQSISEMKVSSPTQESEYLSTRIGKMIFWTICMDIPIWSAKCCYYYPNFIMMLLSMILPSHIWLRLFPRLLALLR